MNCRMYWILRRLCEGAPLTYQQTRGLAFLQQKEWVIKTDKGYRITAAGRHAMFVFEQDRRTRDKRRDFYQKYPLR